jgi:tripartite-type tricarboxylate transporter receptor subunit TctC
LQQQFYVENRVGAGGMIGSHEVALAPPDGYTFVISGIASRHRTCLQPQSAL